MAHSLLQLFEDCVHRNGGTSALRFHSGEVWETKSWKTWWGEAERFAASLILSGVEPGDRVAILCETRAEWAVVDIGCMMAGAVVVPLYPSAGVDATAHILRDSAARIAVVENPSQLDKVARAGEANRTIERVILLEREAIFLHGDWDGRSRVALADVDWGNDRPLTNLETVLADGRRALADDAMMVARRRSEIQPDDLATLVYTSGTEKRPKGVELTHGNIGAEANAVRELRLLKRDDVQLLFLPLAHIFARVLLFAAIAYRIETVMGRGPGFLLEDARETKPTFFAAVPQIFERLQLSLETEARRGGGWRDRLFDVASSQPDRFGGLGQRVANELMRRRIDSTLGENLRFAVSGGAPLPRATCAFFCASGLPLVEGYGLTETTAVTCANHPDDVRPGTVGRPLPGVEVAIDEDGEILVRGDTVTRGYHGRDEPLLDDDGWFATGDLGQFDRDGYLTITGRKKEVIVTSGGKNIPPAPIETALRASALVADAYAHGDGRPYVVVLIAPQTDVLVALAAEEGVELPPPARWNDDPWMRQTFGRVVDELNATRARFEAIRRFAIVESFDADDVEKTPTGKLKRAAIAEGRAEIIDALYAQD